MVALGSRSELANGCARIPIISIWIRNICTASISYFFFSRTKTSIDVRYNTVKLLSGHHCAASHPCLSLELTRENCTNFAKNCWLLCENATQTGKFRFALEMFKNFVTILLRSLNSSWSSSLEYTLSKHWQRRGEGVGEEGGGEDCEYLFVGRRGKHTTQGPSLHAYYPCYEYLSTCILPMLWIPVPMIFQKCLTDKQKQEYSRQVSSVLGTVCLSTFLCRFVQVHCLKTASMSLLNYVKSVIVFAFILFEVRQYMSRGSWYTV